MDLGAPKTLRAVQVNFADYLSGRYRDAPDIYTEFTLESSLGRQAVAAPGHHRVPIGAIGPTPIFSCHRRSARATCATCTGTSVPAHLAISDLRVFGDAGGRAPSDSGVA